jgi:threonine dehydratase
MTSTPLLKANNLKDYLKVDFDIYLKREDLHPLGSHKGRSLPGMIEYYVKQGLTDFVISSSGNAGIATALYIIEYNKQTIRKLTLKIFIGKNISRKKYKTLKKLSKNEMIELVKTDRPKQQAFLLDKNNQAKNLRQSSDAIALVGYEALAEELNNDLPNISEIFIPTSSGTTAVGLWRGFQKLNNQPKINIVQTTVCHPFVFSDKKDKKSLAGAIVDKVGHRKKDINYILTENEQGFVADNKEIKTAIKLIKKTEKIKISSNSALSVAGLFMKMKEKSLKGNVVCLLTGK